MKIKLLLIITAVFLSVFPIVSFGQATAPNLNTTANFAVFTGTGASFTNTGVTSVIGDIGASTATTYTIAGITLTGNSRIPGSSEAATAAADVLTAYSGLNQLPETALGVTIVNGQTIIPGVFNTGAAATLDGTVTLDAGGNPNAIFVIKIGGAFSVGSTLTANLNLINSASFCNVYWQVNGAFSLAAGSNFGGTVISQGAISLLAGSSLIGRALSTAGSIDLHDNVITITSIPATPGPISGTLAQCPGLAGQNYSITAVPGATSYTWTVPTGWVVTAGALTNSITLTSGAFGDDGNITVTANNGCGTSSASSLAVTVNPSVVASVSISAAPLGAICAGTSVTFTAAPVNGGVPTYQWKSGGVDIGGATNPTYTSAALVNAEAITVVMTSTAACVSGSPATSNTVTMAVNAAVVASVSISAAPIGAICAGTSVTFTAAPVNGGVPTYQWKSGGVDIVGATNPTYTSAALVNAEAITVVMTSTAACVSGSPATSNTVTMAVNPSVVASVSISAAPLGAICAGTSVTFTAAPVNGGVPTYQWKSGGVDIGGATNPTYTSAALVNAEAITVVMTSTAACVSGSPATSNTVTMAVNAAVVASVSISAAPIGAICAGTSVTFTAAPVNGGVPTYQWKSGGVDIVGATNPTYTSAALVNAEAITVVMTSTAACVSGSPATSNTVTMAVNPSVVASVSISAAPLGAICAGTSVTFTAAPVNGGIQTYQWKSGGVDIGGATNPTYTSAALVNAEAITVVMTSTAACVSGSPATSNTVTMAVNPSVVASVSISAAPLGAICAGTSVTFTAAPVNGGIQTYQWKSGGVDIGGATNPTYTSAALVNAEAITVVMTSTAACVSGSPATSNTVTMAVNPSVVASVSISAAPLGAICAGTSVTFTAAPVNGGVPTYQWKSGGVDIVGATNPTYTSAALVNAEAITVVMTSTAACVSGSPATSNTVTMAVNPSVVASVSISAAPLGAICAGTSVTFTAAPVNGGVPTYQWKSGGVDIVGATNPTYTSAALVNAEAITVVMTSTAACVSGSPATSNTVTMAVNPSVVASVSISAAPLGAICAGTSVTFTAAPVNGGIPTYQWKSGGVDIGGATNPTYTSAALVNAEAITVVMTSTAACVSGSPATSGSINMIIGSVPSVLTSAITQPTCVLATGSVDLSGLPAGSWTINPGSIAGNTVSTTVLGLVPGTYSYTVTNAAGCTSVASANVVINAQPATPAAPTAGVITQPTCAVATGSYTITNYDASYTYIATPSAGVTISGSTVTAPAGSYTLTATLGSCTSVASASAVVNAQPVTPAAPIVSTITQPTCTVATGDVLLSGLTTGTWTLNPGSIAGNTVNTTVSGLIPGTYNYTVTNATGCISTATANIVLVAPTATVGCISPGTLVTINPQPVAPAAPAATIIQPTCISVTGTITVTTPTGIGMTYSIDGINYTNTTGIFTLPAGLYNITARNASGCISTGTSFTLVATTMAAGCISPGTVVTIIAQPAKPVAVANSNSPVISGSSIVLTAIAVPGATYLWTGPNGFTSTLQNPVILSSTLADAGTYTLTVTSNSCVSVPSVTTVSVGDNSTDLSIENTVDNIYPLIGKEVIFTIVVTNNGPGNATGVSVSNIPESGYTAVSSIASVGTYDPSTGLWNIGNINDGTSVTLTITEIVNPDGGYVSTSTTTGNEPDGNTANNTSTAITYPIDFSIPEGFSPNGDGINDEIIIRGISTYPDNSIVIFNRWGIKVYEASPYKNDWDGRSIKGLKVGGDELPVGTYFYLLDLGDGSKTIKGTFYLNR